MIRFIHYRLLAIALGLACLAACSTPVEPAPAVVVKLSKPSKVLFIGNSLTFCNDLPGMVKQLASRAPVPSAIEVESCAKPGLTLRAHWRAGEAVEKIRQGGWSHVVLQGHSAESFKNKEDFFACVRLFDEEIRKVGAQTVLYMTWALQKSPEQQSLIAEGYTEIGREIQAPVIPVGLARQHLLELKPDAPIYTRDGKHPTPQGTYLAACLFHAMFHDCSPLGLPGELPVDAAPGQRWVEMEPADVVVYQQVAERTAKQALGGL